MPRQIQPPTLRQASIDNIACHFNDYWCAGVTSNLLEDSDQTDSMNPFQYLRDDMIQEIIDQLYGRFALRPHHFKLLLHSNIRRLHLKDLRRVRDGNVIIKMLCTRCQKLIDLKLTELHDDVKPELLCSLLRHLPQITSLDLHSTRLDDTVVNVISENCPNLIDLHVSWCNLDDNDFLYLFDPETHGKTFPKLRKLSLQSHCINKHTVARLLKSHSTLRSLGECAFIDHAFDQMYGKEFLSVKEVSPEWIHNLSVININGSSYGELKTLSEADRLDLTFQCCPFLTELTLRNIKDPESLKHVSKLKHLNTIQIHMNEPTHFSLYMAPLLCKIGENLTSLKLIGFENVSLTQIGQLCVNLECLSLYGGSIRPEHLLVDGHINHDDPYFTKLNVINIGMHNKSSSDTPGVLHELLQNATELREMIFHGVEGLTDKIVSDANRKHGFRHLRKCYLRKCPSISVESLWELLSPDNPLEELTFRECGGQGTDRRLLDQEVFDRRFKLKLIIF